MKQENEKKPYEAPALTTVTFKTERGYALSSQTQSIWIGAWMSGGDASSVNGVNNYDVLTTW